MILSAVFPLPDLLALTNIGTLVAFAIVCVGVLLLRFLNPTAQRPFRAPFLPFFAVAGALACFFLITQLQFGTWVRYGVWFVVGIAVYFAYGYWHSRLRTGIAPPAA
jgi:APA family basic amino acid/polyamine antiporter